MGKKIYVGNLSYSMDDHGLNDVFAAFGTVESAKIITDRDSGRSKGFGFVEMSTDDEATKAIEGLNGSMQFDRAMNVSEAKPQTDRPRNNSNRGSFNNRSRY